MLGHASRVAAAWLGVESLRSCTADTSTEKSSVFRAMQVEYDVERNHSWENRWEAVLRQLKATFRGVYLGGPEAESEIAPSHAADYSIELEVPERLRSAPGFPRLRGS